MNDSESLLQAVLDNPSEDSFRLVYADWLQEHGQQDLAELIRVQCQIAREMPPKHRARCNCKGCQLRRRVGRLLDDDNREAWFAIPGINVQLCDDPGLASWWVPPNGPRIEAAVTRGFVTTIRCTAEAWSDHGPAIVATQPVTILAITDRMPFRSAISYTFHSGTGFRDADFIPTSWWHYGPLFTRVHYETPDEAVLAMQASALAWANAQSRASHPVTVDADYYGAIAVEGNSGTGSAVRITIVPGTNR